MMSRYISDLSALTFDNTTFGCGFRVWSYGVGGKAENKAIAARMREIRSVVERYREREPLPLWPTNGEAMARLKHNSKRMTKGE